MTGAGGNGRLKFTSSAGPLGFEFDGTTNGMSVGFRTTPEDFVITSLPGFGGSDVLTVTRTGHLTMTGEITGAELSGVSAYETDMA